MDQSAKQLMEKWFPGYANLAPNHSRRDLLVSSGTLLLAAPLQAALAIPNLTSTSKLDFVYRNNRLSVVANGQPLWRVASDAFDGAANLDFKRTPHRCYVRLRGACYPGTSLAADFNATLFLSNSRWKLRFVGYGGRFKSVDFLDWLAGRIQLSTDSKTHRTLKLGANEARVPAGTSMTLRPDWTVHLSSAQDIELEFRETVIRCPSLLGGICAEDSEAKSDLDVGTQSVWAALEPNVQRTVWRVDNHEFDIKAATLVAATLETATINGSRSTIAHLEYEKEIHIADFMINKIDVEAPKVPLRDLEVQIRADERNSSISMSANLVQASTWVHRDNFAFRLSASNDGADITAISDQDGDRVELQSILQTIALPVAGADYAYLERETQTDPTSDTSNIDTSLLTIESLISKKNPTLDLSGWTLHVERFRDMLQLDLEFNQVQLRFKRSAYWLEPVSILPPGENPRVNILFPSQHILEEAFFRQTIPHEVLVDTKSPRWNGKDADKIKKELDPDYEGCQAGGGDCANEFDEFDQPVVETTTSGPTRLSFDLWQSVAYTDETRIDLSIDGLLDWSAPSYSPSLSPRAISANPSDQEYANALQETPIKEPGQDVTAIAFPTDVVLSPDKHGRWHHSDYDPANPRQELWHSRLSGSNLRALWAREFDVNYFPHDRRQISDKKDLPAHTSVDGDNLRYSLDKRDKHELVALTSVFGLEALPGTADVAKLPNADNQLVDVFVPKPIQVDHLSLSSQGATAKLRGYWDPPSPAPNAPPEDAWDALTVEELRYRANLSRDAFVRIVYKGFFLPLGHRCSLVKVTERSFARHNNVDGRIKAVLFQRMFIVIGNPDKEYPALGHPFNGRAWPMAGATFTKTVSPDIIDPFLLENKQVDCELFNAVGSDVSTFWPRVSKNCCDFVNFSFNVVHEGGTTTLTGPLLFVDNQTAHDPVVLKRLIDYYNSITAGLYTDSVTGNACDPRVMHCSGSRISYAPSQNPGDTQFETESVRLRCDRRLFENPENGGYSGPIDLPDCSAPGVGCRPGVIRPLPSQPTPTDILDLHTTAEMEAESQPPFYPGVDFASVRIESLRRLSGIGSDVVNINYDMPYLYAGFSHAKNPGEVYARIIPDFDRPNPLPALNVGGNASVTGGVASPSTVVAGLSRKTGLVGGPVPRPNSNGGGAAAGIVSANRLSSSSSSTTVDVLAKTRNNRFDPSEFFAGVLGDAKLLGIVRLADVVAGLLEGADLSSAPRMLEEYLYDAGRKPVGVVINEVQKVLLGTNASPGVFPTIQDGVERIIMAYPEPESARTLLNPLSARLTNMKTRVGGLDAFDVSNLPLLLAEFTYIATEFNRLMGDLRRISRDPSALLPQGYRDAFATAKQFVVTIESVRTQVDTIAQLARSISGDEALTLALKELPDPVEKIIQDTRGRALNAVTAAKQEAEGVVDSAIESVVDSLAAYDELFRAFEEIQNAAALAGDARIAQLTQLLDRLDSLGRTAGANAQTELLNAISKLDEIATHLPRHDVRVPQVRKLLEGIHNEILSARRKLSDLHDSLASQSGERLSERLLNRINAESAIFAVAVGFDAAVVAALAALDTLDPPSRAVLTRAVQAARRTTSRLFAGPPSANYNANSPRELLEKLRLESRQLIRSSSAVWSVLNSGAGFGSDLAALVSQLKSIAPSINREVDELIGTVNQIETVLPTIAERLRTTATDLQQFPQFMKAAEEFLGAEHFLITNATLIQEFATCVGDGKCDLTRFNSYDAALTKLLDDVVDDVVQSINQTVASIEVLAQPDPPGRSFFAAAYQDKFKQIKDDAALYATLRDEDRHRKALRAAGRMMSFTGSLANSISNVFMKAALGDFLDLDALQQRALEALPLPTKLKLGYDWTTKLKPWPNKANPIFEPAASGKQTLTITSQQTIDLLIPDSVSFSVVGRIEPFAIHLMEKQGPFFTVNIEKITFGASTSKPAHYNVQIGDVELGDKFEFIQQLKSLLSPDESDGPYVQLTQSPLGIEVGYRFGFDIQQFGAFTLQNMRIGLAFLLPFNNTPALLTFRLSERERPFLISSGIYGGGGFIGVVARPNGVELVEGAFEFGAVTAIKFGPLSGSGKVTAGFYFSVGPAGGTICGYVTAYGQGKLAWFSISISLRVSICSDGSNVRGAASYKITFKVSRFFKVSFRFTATYTFKGSDERRKEKQESLALLNDDVGLAFTAATGHNPAVPDKLPLLTTCSTAVSRRDVNQHLRTVRRSYDKDLFNKMESR